MAVEVGRAQPANEIRLTPTVRQAGVTVGWIAVILPFLLEILTIVRANHAWLVHRLPDDAFYYLEVGRRLGEGNGFTFDGVHETNGFHPLWQLLLVPVGRVFTTGDSFAKATLVLGVLLTLTALFLVVRVVARAVGQGPALFGAFVAVQGTGAIGGWANGMEGPVVVLALALLLTGLARWAGEPQDRHAMVVGAICSLAVLARFDLAAVVWLVPVAMAWRARSMRWVGRWLLGAAAVAVPFALWWFARWRHVLTTSATVKEGILSDYITTEFGGRWSMGYVGFVWDTMWEYGVSMLRRLRPGSDAQDVLLRIGLVAIALLGAVTQWRVRGERKGVGPTTWAILVVVVLVACKAAVDVVTAPLWATAWYSAPQQLVFPFAIGVFAWIGLRRVISWSTPVGFGVAALVFVMLLPTNLTDFTVSGRRERIPTRWQDELAVASQWIRDEGPTGRYGAFDAGLLGYDLHGQQTLVNLDGLVNNMEYAQLILDRVPLPDLLAYNEIDYVVNRLSDEQIGFELSCSTPIWRSSMPVAYQDAASEHTASYIHVLDVQGCW